MNVPIPIGTGLKALRWLLSKKKLEVWTEAKCRATAVALASEYGDEQLSMIFSQAVIEAAEMQPALVDRAKEAAIEAVYPIAKPSHKYRRDLLAFSVNFAVRAQALAEDRGYRVRGQPAADYKWASETVAGNFLKHFVNVVWRSEDTGLDARIRDWVLEELGETERDKGLLRVLTVAGSSTAGAIATSELGHHHQVVSLLAGAGLAVAATGGILTTDRLLDRSARLLLIERLVGLAAALTAPLHPPLDHRIRQEFQTTPASLADWLATVTQDLRKATSGVGTAKMVNGPPGAVAYTYPKIVALQEAYLAFASIVDAVRPRAQGAEYAELVQTVRQLLDHFADHFDAPAWSGPGASVEAFVRAVDLCIVLSRSLAVAPNSPDPNPEQEHERRDAA